jgi:hypothetical protein
MRVALHLLLPPCPKKNSWHDGLDQGIQPILTLYILLSTNSPNPDKGPMIAMSSFRVKFNFPRAPFPDRPIRFRGLSSAFFGADNPEEGAMRAIRPEPIRAHVRFLADDLLEGRGTGTRGFRFLRKDFRAD